MSSLVCSHLRIVPHSRCLCPSRFPRPLLLWSLWRELRPILERNLEPEQIHHDISAKLTHAHGQAHTAQIQTTFMVSFPPTHIPQQRNLDTSEVLIQNCFSPCVYLCQHCLFGTNIAKSCQHTWRPKGLRNACPKWGAKSTRVQKFYGSLPCTPTQNALCT